jgi:hypothetical protein
VRPKAGEEWLVTSANAEKHIPDVYEIDWSVQGDGFDR